MPKKQYDDTNRGMLFRVRAKKTEKHPDLNGKLNIDGTEHWVSGWWQQYTDNESGELRTGISLSLGDPVKSKSEAKRVEAQAGGGTPTKKKSEAVEDDIPF